METAPWTIKEERVAYVKPPHSSQRGQPLHPTFLRCEYRIDPVGIDETAPRLSWRLESDRRGEKQTAFQVLIASSIETLARDAGDLWDTGRVEGDQTTGVVRAGAPLASRMQCFW